MKPLLFVALAASLAGNIALGVLAWRTESQSPVRADAGRIAASDNPTSANSGHAARAGAQAPEETPAAATRWQPIANDDDLRTMVGTLRAAGYPPAVIRAITRELINERFRNRDPLLGQPFWKLNRPTPEQVAARNALDGEKRNLLEQILGPDAAPSAMLDPVARERKYGPLSSAKIDQVAKIERDYDELTAETWAARKGNLIANQESSFQAQRMMEQEKLDDLAKILTPDELREYALRNTRTAQTMMSQLGTLELTPAEFAAVYDVQKSFDDAHPMKSSITGEEYSQRQLDQLKRNDSLRAILGDDRFFAYFESSDPHYANTAKALGAQPAATAYAVYQMQAELMNSLVTRPGSGPPSPERVAELQKLSESYNDRLNALLGPAAADAYRKQPAGSMFNAFRKPPGKTGP